MSASHKVALAESRRESRAIGALDTGPAKRGRKRTPSSIDARLARIAASLKGATHLKQLELIQERMNLEAERAKLGVKADVTALEKGVRRSGKVVLRILWGCSDRRASTEPDVR
jgi:hypothetical protein